MGARRCTVWHRVRGIIFTRPGSHELLLAMQFGFCLAGTSGLPTLPAALPSRVYPSCGAAPVAVVEAK